jgi:L-histidine N-alpha-methyltransferase
MSGKVICQSGTVSIKDYLDNDFKEEISRDVLEGLSSSRKSLPSKYFYDARGSKLFEDICGLEEYYQTRTEMGILGKYSRCILETLGGGDLVELGSGASWKISTLLSAMDLEELRNTRYIPIDVSKSAIQASTEELTKNFSGLTVRGIVADFSKKYEVLKTERRMLVLFFGSTIGNLDEETGISFLRGIAESMKPEDSCLVGFDMVKEKSIIEDAYNDSEGVTADFNKNVLRVINRELDANFDLKHFNHLSYFNKKRNSIETYLQANRSTEAEVQEIGLRVKLKEGETIHTEISRKFTMESIIETCAAASFNVTNWFTDEKDWFSLVQMSPAKSFNYTQPATRQGQHGTDGQN